MLANIVEKWCLRGWYKNQKIPDLCGGAEQLHLIFGDGGSLLDPLLPLAVLAIIMLVIRRMEPGKDTQATPVIAVK
ncbi:hypothetical protein [Endozoicomonas sp. SCSIO W0465]|uniref:hypothetical protein n=1 Tax=Endozoicomonas sp. SCSIO W0465 TaxID=2918516 RepID=UPI002075DF6F|nr:hypothetical protein [Endozoicomonas sp. SCSIO W0465]USE36196.1 hypothetical protein MJO57_29840 [Endozoicomonas sp. SCSIO W0465]